MARFQQLGEVSWSVVCAACCHMALVFAVMHLYKKRCIASVHSFIFFIYFVCLCMCVCVCVCVCMCVCVHAREKERDRAHAFFSPCLAL